MNTINDEIVNIEFDTSDFQKLQRDYTPNPNAKVLDLIPDNDSRLYQESLFYFGDEDFDINQLILDLTETMRYHGGIGISAIQCGIPVKLFLVETGEEKPKVFINAKIVDTSEATCDMDEGCLTYPGMVVKVTRPKAIRIRYTDETGNTETDKYGGLTARIVQHEYAHTQGETIKTAVSRLRWEQAANRKKKRK